MRERGMSVKAGRSAKTLVEAARTCLGESTFAPEKAAELLHSAVLQDPTYVNALVLRSSLAARLGHLSAALADISLAIEVDKGSNDARRLASLYGTRASVCYRMSRYTDAVTDLRSALRCEPDNGMWCYELGRVHMKQGSVSMAQWCLQQALQEPQWARINEATRPKVYALYGRSCLFSREYKKAKSLLHKSIEAGGDGPAAVLHDVGLAHYYEGTSLGTAVDFFTRATDADGHPMAYPMHLSLALVRTDRYTDALTSMNEAVLRGRDESLLRFYRGCIELQLGMGPQAFNDLQAASMMEADQRPTTPGRPTAPRAALAMGLVHIFCGKDLASAAAALEAEPLRQTTEKALRLHAGLLLGFVRHEEGDRHAALRALLSVMQVLRGMARPARGPQESGDAGAAYVADAELLALTHLGLAYGDCGYGDLAARHLEEARHRAAQQHRPIALQELACFRLAVAQLEQHDHTGALQTLRTRPVCVATPTSSNSTATSPFPAFSPPPGDASATDRPEATAATSPALHEPGNAYLDAATHLVRHSLSDVEMEHLHAVLLRRLGRLEEALTAATTALAARERLSPRTSASARTVGRHGVPAFLFNRALIFFSLARYSEALTDVQDCVLACGDGPAATTGVAEPHFLEGRIHHAMGAHVAALESLTAALRVNPALQQSPPFAYAHGVLLAIAGRLEEALVAFTAAIEVHTKAPATTPAHRPRHIAGGFDGTAPVPLVFYHERAKVHQQLGRYGDALDDYNVVLGHPPGTSPPASDRGRADAPVSFPWNALVNRALTLKELRRYDEAAADWDVALRRDSSGLLGGFTSQDVFELPYMDLCLPGEELAAASLYEPAHVQAVT